MIRRHYAYRVLPMNCDDVRVSRRGPHVEDLIQRVHPLRTSRNISDHVRGFKSFGMRAEGCRRLPSGEVRTPELGQMRKLDSEN